VAVKLHRCPNLWVKIQPHPCWKVQKALDDAGIEYEIVPGPLRRSERAETVEKTGQNRYPWIELEDGTVIREESKALAQRIREGRLFEAQPQA
jgi:glutathione S-transferase